MTNLQIGKVYTIQPIEVDLGNKVYRLGVKKWKKY